MDQEPSPADNPYQASLPEEDVNKSVQPTAIQIVMAAVTSLIVGIVTFNVTCISVTILGIQLLRSYLTNPFVMTIVGALAGGVAGFWLAVKGFRLELRSSVEKNRR